MLSDAQIERWSRQILVPEVGGRGQARLCAAVVEVTGAPLLVAELIERAGPRVAVGDVPAVTPDVVVQWRSPAAKDGLAGREPAHGARARGPQGAIGAVARTPLPTIVAQMNGARGLVTALAGSPCAACVAAPALAVDGAPAATPVERAAERTVAALVASEVVRLLVVPDAAGRVHHLDLAAGTFTAEPTRGTGRCTVCGAAA